MGTTADETHEKGKCREGGSGSVENSAITTPCLFLLSGCGQAFLKKANHFQFAAHVAFWRRSDLTQAPIPRNRLKAALFA